MHVQSPLRILIAMTAPITVMIMFCIILALSDFRLEYCPHEPCYCENRTSTSIVAQPINAWSTLLFVVVSFFIAFHSSLFIQETQKFIEVWCWVFSTAFLGPGSLVFHAYYTFWGEILDASSMYIFLSVLIATEICRRIPVYNPFVFVLVVAVLAPLTCSSEAWLYDGQKEYVFVALIVLYLIIALLPEPNYCMKRVYFLFALIFMIIATVIWWLSRTDGSALCHNDGFITGHAIWHLLTAVVVFFLYIHERPWTTAKS